jgi:hypothetical protein
MATCPNCGNKLGCGCQKRTLADGTQGCVSCSGKTSGSNKGPVIARPKKKINNVSISGKGPSQLTTWGSDRYNNLEKYIKK